MRYIQKNVIQDAVLWNGDNVQDVWEFLAPLGWDVEQDGTNVALKNSNTTFYFEAETYISQAGKDILTGLHKDIFETMYVQMVE